MELKTDEEINMELIMDPILTIIGSILNLNTV